MDVSDAGRVPGLGRVFRGFTGLFVSSFIVASFSDVIKRKTGMKPPLSRSCRRTSFRCSIFGEEFSD
jgi:hypothetical protein